MASAGDSYIGSLISLISKYEIRYEGVLYQLNVQDSTIGLKNVRSFGTEGRKRDGPQVLPSDKVYEFILFRGSDIKDLQVKSSPPAKTEEQIPNDPAIIQSQYADESLASPPLASVGKDNLTESTQWKDTPALRNIGYSGTHSSYHSPIQMGSELSSVTPTTMYHQGYPRTLVNSLNPQNHIAAPPAPITSNPLSVQPPLQALEIQTSMNLGSASSSEFRTPVPTTVNLKFSPSFPPMQYPTPLNVPLSASTEASQPSHSISFTANMPTMPTFPFPHQDLVGNETQIVQKAVSNPNQVLPVHTAEAYLPSDSASLAANAPNVPSFPFSHQDVNTNETQAVHKAVSDPTQPLPVQTMPYSTSSLMGQNLGPLLTPSPSLLRPDNSAHSGSQILPSTQNLYASQQNMGAPVPMPSNTSSRLPVYVTQAPLLPLPSSSQKFTEEFDFEAMNEKFKKDEVWDYLGKAKQVDKGDGGEVNTAGLRLEEKEGHGVATSKAAYNKDDFFDSISCNSLGHGPRKGQDRFSEQMRHSTDSFGFEYRPNRGYGGYGAGRSENFRGPHNWGRGYGYYGGRGRGGNNHF